MRSEYYKLFVIFLFFWGEAIVPLIPISLYLTKKYLTFILHKVISLIRVNMFIFMKVCQGRLKIYAELSKNS